MLTGLLACALLASGADHAGAIKAAAADVSDPRRVPPFLRVYTRYLDFSDAPKEMLPRAVKVLQGHVNALSRDALIRIPPMVTPTLMRLVIKDYHWKSETWESLKDVDPYYHVTLVKDDTREYAWPGGIWHEDGKYYRAGAFRVVCGKSKKKVVLAVQCHTDAEILALLSGKIKEAQTAIGQLVEATQSEVPIVDALWFYQQTAADFGRKPGYHDFLAFQNQKEFEQLLGFNEIDSRNFDDLWREAVGRSKVLAGGGARRIEVFSKLKGFLWRTKDSQIKIDRRNPLRVVDDQLEFDASEQLGALPNGFLASGLFDFKGVNQPNAPDKVVGWVGGVNNDTKLHNYISCVTCHSDAGIKDYKPWFRKLFLPPRGLESADYDQFLQLSRQYLAPLEDAVEDSRTIYTRAIFRATGMAPKEWSDANYELWSYYLGAEVDVVWAARSLGVSVKVFQDSLASIKAKSGNIDPVLATFLRPPAESIAIDAWEEAYPVAQAYLRGFVP